MLLRIETRSDDSGFQTLWAELENLGTIVVVGTVAHQCFRRGKQGNNTAIAELSNHVAIDEFSQIDVGSLYFRFACFQSMKTWRFSAITCGCCRSSRESPARGRMAGRQHPELLAETPQSGASEPAHQFSAPRTIRCRTTCSLRRLICWKRRVNNEYACSPDPIRLST
jgi:hypothetical protein